MTTENRLNTYQRELYEQLMRLVASGDSGNRKSFFFKDQQLEQLDCGGDLGNKAVEHYRIFSYRLASYTDFQAPGALESRGIMFQVSKDDKNEEESGGVAVPLRLASHPMEKFFNLNENPFTMNLDLSTVDVIEDKADGSLISTFQTQRDGRLRLKSKASLQSKQVKAAEAWLDQEAQKQFKQELCLLADMDHTVNMEWVSPRNRIVVGYAQEELRVLTVRSNADGEYLDREDLPESAIELRARWTRRIEPPGNDPASFVSNIPKMHGVEGFVVRLRGNGMRVKVKTSWYLSLHRTKDSVGSPLLLFQAVLEEATDDLKSAFHEDEQTLRHIADMEHLVSNHYNQLESRVETFYERNQDLGRKQYAILANQTMGKAEIGLAMSRFSGKELSYKEHMLKHAKSLLKQWGMDET